MKTITVILLSFFLVACQLPSETRVVSDNSAGISFSFANVDKRSSYQVYVDGLAMGDARAYLSGEHILKIISGTHVITVQRDGQEVLREKIYVSSGTNKVLVIPQ